MNKNLYFICGPTAIGKSFLAIKLAKKLNGIIVNADSMQVYSNLQILTARPTIDDLKKVPHYLYGYVDGSIRYNVAKWCEDISKIFDKKKKNNIPIIIVGGSGMYIYTLLNGLINLPSIPEEQKKESKKKLDEIGISKFVELIKKFDKEALEQIATKDTTRLLRIWDLYHLTGIPFSELKKRKNKNFINNLSYKIFLFIPPREDIYRNVNKRFEDMVDNGAIEEVKSLLLSKFDNNLPIMRAHGVPEISNYLNKNYDLDECINKSQQVTRNYVKRQLTWWRSSTLNISEVFQQFPSQIDLNLIKI